MGQTRQFIKNQTDDVPDTVLTGSHIDPEHAHITIRGQVRMDGIGETPLFPDFLKQTLAHAAAQHGVQQKTGITLGAEGRRGGTAHDQMDLL